MTGELLAGRYQLEEELGRGGMATVFLATDLRLSRRVAVKLMHAGTDGRRAERFRREAELVASLKHPNVLEIHDFGEDAARGPFLVCEWVRGESPRELTRRLSPLAPEAAAVVGWELARALGPLKLADPERLTSTGAITGSLAYMAPERIDTGAFSRASDVYAVGVILFELCAGCTPHGGKGAAHLAASVMTKDAPPLAQVVPGTPEPLNALVARCLARDARDRPATGVELERLLEDVVGRIAGPPAEESRAFFLDPEGCVARRRELRFQSLTAPTHGAQAQHPPRHARAHPKNSRQGARPPAAQARRINSCPQQPHCIRNPATPAEPTKPATLKLTTRPWAEVFVDGQSRGYTPRVRELTLSPGKHRLRFVNPLCDAVEQDVEVAAGETLTREVQLQVRKAEVSISAPEGARVFIDGVEAGVAPLLGPLNVEHGRHVISARVPGGAPLQREVDVVAGKRTEGVLEGAP